MKKKLLLFIPLVALASCSQPAETFIPYVDVIDGLPAIRMYAGGHTTYLMMSPFGYIDMPGAPVKGKVTEKFYENTITWVGEPGSPLPGKDAVKSEVEGASFRCWAYYNEDNDAVFPDTYTTVPAQDGLALKAIFDGTDAGGSGGEMPSEGYGFMFSDGKYIVASPTDEFDGFKQYTISNTSFTVGQSFTLYDFGNNAAWIVPLDGYSFGGDSASSTKWREYLSDTNSTWTVLTNFTANVYIKLKMNQDQVYFGLAA